MSDSIGSGSAGSASSQSARAVAWTALVRIGRDGAFANLVVPSLLATSHLSREDRAFVTDLVYGTTRMRRKCDAIIDRFITSEPDPPIRDLLRLGAYQLLVAGVPPHAAVSATVELAPRRIRGFVNAVLRRIAVAPAVSDDLAVELSYPDWIVERFEREMDAADARAALVAMNQPALMQRRDDGYVQDFSSRWVVESTGVRPGDHVLDVCAGPGGKATGLARSGAKVVASDLQVHRARLVARNASALGVDVEVVAADGCRAPFRPESFDVVLLDAPCSGLGALRRRADARWRIGPEDIETLVDVQRRLIEASAELVRPGGVLVYSVCTVTRAESIDHEVPEGFQPIGREGDDRLPSLDPIWRTFGAGFRVLPQDHRGSGDVWGRDWGTDGMTLLRYRRRS